MKDIHLCPVTCISLLYCIFMQLTIGYLMNKYECGISLLSLEYVNNLPTGQLATRHSSPTPSHYLKVIGSRALIFVI